MFGVAAERQMISLTKERAVACLLLMKHGDYYLISYLVIGQRFMVLYKHLCDSEPTFAMVAHSNLVSSSRCVPCQLMARDGWLYFMDLHGVGALAS